MASLQKYQEALVKELKKLYNKYEARIEKQGSGKHKSRGGVAGTIIPVSTAVGAGVGSLVLPGVGTAVGGALGALGGTAAVGIMVLHHHRIKKKLENATKVTKLFEDIISNEPTLNPSSVETKSTPEELFERAAGVVLEQRRAMVLNLKEGNKGAPLNKKLVTKYLAANMMAALKKHAPECETEQALVDKMITGAEEKLSKKVPSIHLLTKDHKPMTLDYFARPHR